MKKIIKRFSGLLMRLNWKTMADSRFLAPFWGQK